MAPIRMWNMTTFPIERLCFDLKLEVLEQLDARDVIELVKVNQGFLWMISSRPSTVFGHDVHDIQFGFGPRGIKVINIKKLNGNSLKQKDSIVQSIVDGHGLQLQPNRQGLRRLSETTSGREFTLFGLVSGSAPGVAFSFGSQDQEIRGSSQLPSKSSINKRSC
ncbi:unnamed protein product, partial [Mesorhabditis belari]|uniref:F-box domain-containing protein n=1 Tax=Mesorhabditis belari TaxID=2138241 RepID=A0AAF3ERZ6_9BILA